MKAYKVIITTIVLTEDDDNDLSLWSDQALLEEITKDGRFTVDTVQLVEPEEKK